MVSRPKQNCWFGPSKVASGESKKSCSAKRVCLALLAWLVPRSAWGYCPRRPRPPSPSGCCRRQRPPFSIDVDGEEDALAAPMELSPSTQHLLAPSRYTRFPGGPTRSPLDVDECELEVDDGDDDGSTPRWSAMDIHSIGAVALPPLALCSL